MWYESDSSWLQVNTATTCTTEVNADTEFNNDMALIMTSQSFYCAEIELKDETEGDNKGWHINKSRKGPYHDVGRSMSGQALVQRRCISRQV